MAKAKPKKPPTEDEAQSLRFLEMARELEAGDGGRSPTDAESILDALVRTGLPAKHEKP